MYRLFEMSKYSKVRDRFTLGSIPSRISTPKAFALKPQRANFNTRIGVR
jgi:hypothetical protein